MELMAVNKQVRRAVGRVPSPSTNSNQRRNIPETKYKNHHFAGAFRQATCCTDAAHLREMVQRNFFFPLILVV